MNYSLLISDLHLDPARPEHLAGLEALLDKYADEGIAQIEQTQILTISPFTEFGTPIEIIRSFGGLGLYQQAVHDLEQALYSAIDTIGDK